VERQSDSDSKEEGMSDLKKCPMKKNEPFVINDQVVEVGFCGQQECAWWVREDYAIPGNRPPVDIGHCVLMDIGRRR
jgi:hypothetical protein